MNDDILVIILHAVSLFSIVIFSKEVLKLISINNKKILFRVSLMGVYFIFWKVLIFLQIDMIEAYLLAQVINLLILLSIYDYLTMTIPILYLLSLLFIGINRILLFPSIVDPSAIIFSLMFSLVFFILNHMCKQLIGSGDLVLIIDFALFLNILSLNLVLIVASVMALIHQGLLLMNKKHQKVFAFGPYLACAFCLIYFINIL